MRKLIFPMLIPMVILSGCGGDETPNPNIEIPDTYAFTRNGQSTVSFSGQSNRLDMLTEIKSYLGQANAGSVIDAGILLSMYANENNPFGQAELNTSGKQLENKTFATDVEFFKNLLAGAAGASADHAEAKTPAAPGSAGYIERGNSGNEILVDEKGWEYQQVIEKGLMGAVFLNQIFNVYLTDGRIGAQVENEVPEEGKNYTAREHHWDEAFGYWGVPVDFPEELSSAENRFWAKYSYGLEDQLETRTALKEAFLKGRTAIVNDDAEAMNEARDEIYTQFELVAAATAIHYINQSLEYLNAGDQGNLFHSMSEAYGFVLALKYSPEKNISSTDIDEILNTHFGADGNFWWLSADDLSAARTVLTSAFPDLQPIATEL